MRKMFVISMTLAGLTLLVSMQSYAQQQARPVSPLQATKNIKIISSAGARALADACSAWAEQNKQTVAMAILDWGGNLIESHAMEGAAANAIDTALLKAKSALRWRRRQRLSGLRAARRWRRCDQPARSRSRYQARTTARTASRTR